METTLDLTDRTLLKDLHEYVLKTRKMQPVMAYTRWDDVEMCHQLSFAPTNDDYDGWQPLYATPLALEDAVKHFFYSQPLRTHLAPYAFDAPDDDNEGGTTLVYANYYHRYDHPLPDVAKPLYAEPIDNVMLRKSISDLSDMYQRQCKCTDEWAKKYNDLLASIESIKVVSAS